MEVLSDYISAFGRIDIQAFGYLYIHLLWEWVKAFVHSDSLSVLFFSSVDAIVIVIVLKMLGRLLTHRAFTKKIETHYERYNDL